MFTWLLGFLACSPSYTPGSSEPSPSASEGWYPDRDADGFGDGADPPALATTRSWAWVNNDLDCDDLDPTVFPGANETWADGFTDNDCDGALGSVHDRYGGLVLHGEHAGDTLGRRVVAAGDLDGDGRGELLVSAPEAVTDGESGGSVYRVSTWGSELLVVLGRLDGPAGSYLGASLDGGQDLSGDGIPDVLVGAPGFGEDNEGGCALVSGARWAEEGDLTLPEDALAWLPGAWPEGEAGSDCVFAGDVDADGRSEIAVSAPYASSVPDLDDLGLVALFSGAQAAAGGELPLDRARLTWWGDERETRLGDELASMGDLDGDGAADLLISAWHNPVARIVSGATGAPVATVTGESRARPHRVGDVDGDGHPDLAMVGPDLLLHTGLATRPAQRPETAILRLAADTGFLDAVDLGDRDGDGASETGITAPYGQNGEWGWVGILGSGGLDRPSDASSLRLQASADSGDAYGLRGASIPNFYGPGQDGLALGCFELADHTGAVLTLPVPR